MSNQKVGFVLLNIVMIGVVFSVLAFGASKTFTGVIGDAMCGAKHVMPGSAVECTRACISKASKYALLVGDRVYVLDATDKTVLDTLEKRAGEKVTVTGVDKDDTIMVTSVKAAR